MKEIIEGTSIAKNFKRIYSNFYAYKDGEAFWPSQVVNYSSKIQFIYRVRKNILDNLSCLKEINEKMPKDKQLPFEQIIYLGDSQTDIPSFKVVKNSGGMSICIYSPNEPSSKEVAKKCYDEGRVNIYLEADYREGSELFTLIKNYIENIARKNL
jgi:predicted HAD superfamily phosphohydrolase